VDAIRRRIQLGKLAALPLKDARTKARKMSGLVADGKDPAGDRRAERDALTVTELAERFLVEYASGKRTGQRQRQALEKDALPIIGKAKAAAVRRDDIARITQRMVGRGVTIGASRTFEIVRKMFSWAIANGIIEQNPCQGMEKPFKTRRRERVLSHDEIRAVWSALGDEQTPISHDGRDVLRLCLITGQRLGEVAGMSRDELDLSKAIWTIPSWRSKNGHAHRVPLTDMALDIIKAAIAHTSTEFLFPGYGKDDAVRSSSVGKAVRRCHTAIGIPHWTSHDLRRTAATGMADLAVPPHVIGHVLNHRAVTQGSITDQVYNRYSYDREKRDALEKWSASLAAILEGTTGEVIALRSA
jgi:integrase